MMYLITNDGVITGSIISFANNEIKFRSENGRHHIAHCSQVFKSKFNAEKVRFKQECFCKTEFYANILN